MFAFVFTIASLFKRLDASLYWSSLDLDRTGRQRLEESSAAWPGFLFLVEQVTTTHEFPFQEDAGNPFSSGNFDQRVSIQKH